MKKRSKVVREILIVEENKTVKKGLKKTLESFVGVVFVDENNQVLSKIKDHGRFDIIILDKFKVGFVLEPEDFIAKILELCPDSRIMTFSYSKEADLEYVPKVSLYAMVKSNTI